LEPALPPFLPLLLPHVEELLRARIVGHRLFPPYDRAASQLDTLGQQCTDAPRPAMSEMWPPGSSPYSLSVLDRAPVGGFTQPGGAMLSSLAPPGSPGRGIPPSRTGRPPMVSSPR